MVDKETLEKLIDSSFAAKETAYCPYSKFPVGAAILCPDGTIIKGSNVENVSFSITVCAERSAICTAVCQGYRKFTAIVISSDVEDSYLAPCGNCRQTLGEFGFDTLVYLTKPDRTFVVHTVGDLLPMAFQADKLKK